MTHVPIVSIVMPAYNVENYISDAIESVLAQTMGDWELLVVDDGSTDASGAIASRYARRDARIQVYHKNNGGLSDARNYGLERVRGAFVHFFDSDDTIQPDFYEKLLAEIEHGGYDFVICGYYKDVENKFGEEDVYMINYQSLYTETDVRTHFHCYQDYLFNYAWNKLFKRDFIISNNLRYKKGLSVIEDREFMSRVVAFRPHFCITDYVGYRYKVRKRDTLSNHFDDAFIRSHIDGIQIQSELLARFCDDEMELNDEVTRKTMVSCIWLFYCIVCRSGLGSKKSRCLIGQVTQSEIVRANMDKGRVSCVAFAILRFMIRYNLSGAIYCIFKLRNMRKQ